MKSTANHRIAITAALLAVLAMACTFFTTLLNPTSEPTTTAEPVSTSPMPERTADEAAPTAIGPPGAAVSTDDVAAQMDAIEKEVESLRGLRSSDPVERTLLTPDDLYQKVLDDFLDDYTEEEAGDDAKTLALFGLLDPDFDLWDFYLELYSEQVAGFYDDETKRMYIVQGAKFGGTERLTYAHEFVHALQDQNYDLSGGLNYNDEACEADSERCAAIQALVEGDATVIEDQWLRTYATRQDLADFKEFYDTFKSPVFDSAPYFMQQDFLFPYLAGRVFVESLFNRDGWAAVDAVYLDPPLSTEQILHPERYPADAPVRLQPPESIGTLGEGWREIDRDVLGEWYTRLVLGEVLADSETVASAAQGWGGDFYVAFYNESEAQGALVWIVRWDTVPDAHEFFATLRDYGDARFGDPEDSTTSSAAWSGTFGHALAELRSVQTLWVLAPDGETATALRQAVEFPAKEQ